MRACRATKHWFVLCLAKARDKLTEAPDKTTAVVLSGVVFTAGNLRSILVQEFENEYPLSFLRRSVPYLYAPLEKKGTL